MHVLFSICLQLIHCIYAAYLFASSFRERRQRRQPQLLLATRRRLPKHLAILFIAPPSLSKHSKSTAIVESVANAVTWCRQLGVTRLTVYEEHGSLGECETEIRNRLAPVPVDCESSESEVEYHPLTPPASDYSESRPLSPSRSLTLMPATRILISDSPKSEERALKKYSLRRRRAGNEGQLKSSLQLFLVSKDASKRAIAAIATSLAQDHSCKQRKGGRQSEFKLGVKALEAILEGEDGLSSPDFMIVHSLSASHTSLKTPPELHAFPPWHIRLTEIYTSRHYSSDSTSLHLAQPLDESIFCEALDEYAGAEMRFGK